MIANIGTKVAQWLSRLNRKLRHTLRFPIVYNYKKFAILLPSEHLLPVYQRQHSRYDRFLPHLVAALGADATIIDIGANCGDTLAGMVERNPCATYICVEPDAGFFAYLQSNIARMKASLGELSIYTVQSIVGKSVGKVLLAGNGGSRHAIAAKGAVGHASATLDSILGGLPPMKVSLLKSDVDGFDFDVLDSAERLLNEQHPILFFETQCDNQEQFSGFVRTIDWLETLGYHHWTAFDNFGNMVLTSDADVITKLIEYIWKQNRVHATRTIYYLDILACNSVDMELIQRVLDCY